MHTFSMQKDNRAFYLFLFIGGLFLLLGIGIYFLRMIPTYPIVAGEHVKTSNPALPIFIGGMVIIFSWLCLTPKRAYYAVQNGMIIVHRRFKTYQIPLNTIAEIARLNEKEINVIVAGERGINNDRVKKDLLRYASVSYLEVDNTLKFPGDCVGIKTKDGRFYLLSPNDIDGFVAEAKAFIGT